MRYWRSGALSVYNRTPRVERVFERRPFILRTDYEPIRYFQIKARLSGRQHRWPDELQSYSFQVHFVSGKHDTVPDALSRPPDYTPGLKSLEFRADGFEDRIREGYEVDDFSKILQNVLRDGKSTSYGKILRCISNCTFKDGFILWKGTHHTLLFVPKYNTLREDFISSFHDSCHLGRYKVYNRLVGYVYCPHMFEDVTGYISSCHDCQSNYIPHELPGRELQPHNTPDRCWEVITADILTELWCAR